MANDKIVNLAADWMFKAIEAWQSGDGHPLTCGNDSNHILVGKSKRIPGMDIPILACPECDYEQENVPCVIYTSYLRAEIERLEKEKEKVRIDGVKHERSVWVGFILGTDERVRKYWEDYRNGDEFSADDAATITQMMMDDIERLKKENNDIRKCNKFLLNKCDQLKSVRDCAEIALKVCKNPDLFSLNDRVLIASKLQIAMDNSKNQPETVSEFTDPNGRIQCITKQNCAICGKDIPINHGCLYNHKKQEFICMQCEGKVKEESEK